MAKRLRGFIGLYDWQSSPLAINWLWLPFLIISWLCLSIASITEKGFASLRILQDSIQREVLSILFYYSKHESSKPLWIWHMLGILTVAGGMDGTVQLKLKRIHSGAGLEWWWSVFCCCFLSYRCWMGIKEWMLNAQPALSMGAMEIYWELQLNTTE